MLSASRPVLQVLKGRRGCRGFEPGSLNPMQEGLLHGQWGVSKQASALRPLAGSPRSAPLQTFGDLTPLAIAKTRAQVRKTSPCAASGPCEVAASFHYTGKRERCCADGRGGRRGRKARTPQRNRGVTCSVRCRSARSSRPHAATPAESSNWNGSAPPNPLSHSPRGRHQPRPPSGR